jgi:hypothetical protein
MPVQDSSPQARRAPLPLVDPRYGTRQLMADVQEAQRAWKKYRVTRDRDGIYGYLDVIFRLGRKWGPPPVAGRCITELRKLNPGASAIGREIFAFLIYCTSDPNAVTKQDRNKWSRALRFARENVDDGDSFWEIAKFYDGLNNCAEQFTNTMGQWAPGWRSN